jgi:hypothetical protein
MDLEERKNVMKEALTTSFVNDYKDYKYTISLLNKDLKKVKIDFKYTYDEFCIDFLNQTLNTIEDVDIFDVDEFGQFYDNFWKFNLYNLQNMINKKLDEVGVDRDLFYKKSSSFKPKKKKKDV